MDRFVWKCDDDRICFELLPCDVFVKSVYGESRRTGLFFNIINWISVWRL